MGKDRRSDRKRCLRCTQWAEYGSELCADCEQDAVEEMNRLRIVDSATEGWYDDPLDRERADSMVGGE